ncbi:NAD(P)/FAD-dependent oxidoreductase [Sulfurimonas sp.]|uniref:NAD(P)/FAD-dependent oxidoreductase n=1 Tax=Sulfurimonas sp. TaxID=2022749 RepID=UPI0035658907
MTNKDSDYDLIVIGAGAAGMISAITAAKDNKKVLLLEKLPQIGAKLKATGGGRCNLSNTLSQDEFMSKFGRDGRFMQDALNSFSREDMQSFFDSIGVETHAPDGFRIFPTSHSSSTILDALKTTMDNLGVVVLTSKKVENILEKDLQVIGVKTGTDIYKSEHVILATGGLGYPTLGAEGDGFEISKELGHTTTKLYPAMMPLRTKEDWVSNCRADTIAKVTMKVDMKKHKKLTAYGDLIFTKNGIRGPVVLDFAREITPLIDKYSEVPTLINLTKGKNEDELLKDLKSAQSSNPDANILELIQTLLPAALSEEILKLCNIEKNIKFKEIDGIKKEKLLKTLAWTPLTINGHDGFKMAMITRGGIKLNEIDPKTMQSKLIKGLYFCGEIVNIDGPCGGYNLQWSFSSGYLAAKSLD